ncbi:MAG: hypothetical protein A2161_08505 [Candidatus Schekmanbacteria bacterium RBG_13_48_7]|uniref:4Fe-4S Mo/W bis-MGD-type domain-containing protein n=1 Tax=Candidatus Schekmanbacteria bacterium RBG_13_48_7 TaxID=1817878 RepID=A0A1F7RVV5_9BACT|nr:MAG: hypothetical protein A2161_08505 [Candidatus Schekmanbacteria bacterium RBG_13_48_7]
MPIEISASRNSQILPSKFGDYYDCDDLRLKVKLYLKINFIRKLFFIRNFLKKAERMTILNSAICPYCSCGCRLYPRYSANGRLTGLAPLRNHPVSRGSLCIRGWNAHEYVRYSDRLSAPTIRKNGNQYESSWEEAIGIASSCMQNVIQKWGPQSVGFIGSSRCSNEDNYLLMHLARSVVKTGNIDSKNRITYLPVLDAFYEGLRIGSPTITFNQISKADFIMVAGSDLSGSCPQGASRICDALKHNAKLAVVDPRGSNLAKLANHHLKVLPSTDLYWINGMISHLITKEKINAEFINQKTTGYTELRKGLEDFSPAFAEKFCGIPAELMMIVAEQFASAQNAVIIIGSGITNTRDIKKTVRALINLGLITGHIGKESSGILLSGADNNTQGTWDMGVLPDRLPGGFPLNMSNQEKYQQFKFKSKPVAGKNYNEILAGVISGDIHALYIMGDNPLEFHENRNEFEKALSELDLLIVQDLFPSEMTNIAKIVFPASAPFERAGTFTNSERRVQWFDPLIEPFANTKSDWEIIASVFRAMDSDPGVQQVSEITDQISDTIPFYENMKAENLKKEIQGITWLPDNDGNPSEPWLQEDWKGEFSTAFPSKDDTIERREEYPLLLIPGRFHSFWGTGIRSCRTSLLIREDQRSFIQMNPADAQKFGVKNGWRVRVISPAAKIETSVEISENIPPGAVFIPMHKIDGALHQFSRKSQPVRIESC